MKNFKFWRTALSVALVLTVMLSITGGTIAWFTDSVESNDNVIKSGTLDIKLEYWDEEAETEDEPWVEVKDGSKALFDYDLWEPGYTTYKHVRISNAGTLALKYVLNLKADPAAEGKADLAEVIDVYMLPGDADVSREDLAAETPRGTLRDLMNEDDGAAHGVLLTKDTADVIIALKMQESAGNEYQGLSVGDGIAIELLATQYTYEEDSFNNQYDAEAEFRGSDAPGADNAVIVTPKALADIDFTAEGQTFRFQGDFSDEELVIDELGEGSVLDLGDAVFGDILINDDAEMTGKATIATITSQRNSTDPIELTLNNAALDVTGAVNVKNAEGKSVLNITDSKLEAGEIFVGGHTMRELEAQAEFNVFNSYISCEENNLGSTIAIWGESGVDAKIHDSEIHTYSRGWHQSEDSNDNAITFQGGDHLNIDIQRSNMHLYGARSIINARKYYDEDATVDFKIDDSLIWVVTKSTHGEETLPVWGGAVITDSVLLFTKGAYTGNEVVKSFVYGNPVIHGNYAVTTQCGWATDIALADGQTLTLAENADVSVYEDAAEVNFVLTGSAKIVLEKGAKLTKIGVKAAEGYTLNTNEADGVTTYTVTAN